MIRLASLLVLLAGCAFDPPGDCAPEKPCGNGLVCVGGVCVTCTTDDQCPFEGHVCDPTTHRCGAPADACESTRDCGGLATCNTSTHRCEPIPGACWTTSDCPPPQRCDRIAQRCRLAEGACASDADCGTWGRCDSFQECRALPGRCGKPSDCTILERCDETATCVSGESSSDVVALGAIDPGSCDGRAIAPLNDPARATISFDCGLLPTGLGLRPDGELLYAISFGDGESALYAFRADTFVRYGGDEWYLPWLPGANDDGIYTCEHDALDFVVQAGTGAVALRCGDGPWTDIVDRPLFPAGADVLAWAADWSAFVWRQGATAIVSSSATTAVTGLPTFAEQGAQVRVVEDGFRVAIRDELHHVAPDGTTTLEGTYDVLAKTADAVALGSDGALHVLGTGPTGFTQVFRLAPDGTPPVVAYDAANVPGTANHYSARPQELFLVLDAHSLFTTPP